MGALDGGWRERFVGLCVVLACVLWCMPAVAVGSTGLLGSVSAPVLSGAPAVGQMLSCSPGSWMSEASEFSYVWLRDGHPIAGQTASTYVVQEADRGDSLACEVTAASGVGSYTISRLPTGTFDVRFQAGMLGEFGAGSAGNYATTFYQQAFAQSRAMSVQVKSGAVTAGIDAQMPTGGKITGTVSDQTRHAALDGVLVCAALEGFGAGCAETNSSGEYTLMGLETGGYTVTFEASPFANEGLPFSESYDGGATVPVEAGSVTSGIDMELATGTISGTVTSAGSKAALGGIKVCAMLSKRLVRECARTNASGEYAISRLHPGSYDVEFSTAGFGEGNYASQYYEGASTSSAAREVAVVAGGDNVEIDAELQPGGQISGVVSSAMTHAPLGGMDVCAVMSSGLGSSFCASTDAAGEYTIDGLMSGSYSVDFRPPESAHSDYVGSYFNGKTHSSEATPVSVTAGQSTGKVDGELQLGGQISGRVTSAATGAGLGEVAVCGVETSGVGIGYDNRCVQTDADGEYVLPGVPGTSAAVAFQPSAATGNFLGQLYSDQVEFASATKLALTSGASIEGVDAQLLAGGDITGRVTNVAGAGIAGVQVCAEGTGGEQEAIRYQTEDETGECTTSSGAAVSGVAMSNQLAIPTSSAPGKAAEGKFKLLKAAYDLRTGKLDFALAVPSSGRLAWKLSFANASAGFIVMGSARPATASVEIAARAGGHTSRCGKGEISHDRRCVPVLVRLAGGGSTAAAGTIAVEVRPDAIARRALAAGSVLRVTGNFEFRSSAGGSESQPVAIKIKGTNCGGAHGSKRGGSHAARCPSR